MLVEALPMATYVIDPLVLLRVDAAEAKALERRVTDLLHQHMDAWGVEHAVDVPMLSRHLHQEDQRDLMPGVRFVMTWSPDPRLGCEFRGGAADGHVMELPQLDYWGRPARHFVLPGTPSPILGFAAQYPSQPLERFEYERVGIDPTHDRWVYAYRGAR